MKLKNVGRLAEPVTPLAVPKITGEDYVCTHDQIQYRIPTLEGQYAYMCAWCFREIRENKADPNDMGFTNLFSLKLKEYLERMLY